MEHKDDNDSGDDSGSDTNGTNGFFSWEFKVVITGNDKALHAMSNLYGPKGIATFFLSFCAFASSEVVYHLTGILLVIIIYISVCVCVCVYV